MPLSYDIDTAQLTERYRQLQHLVHPDRFSGATEQERRLAAQHAARVNEAYQTLKDALSRARYLLELRGADPTAHGTMAPDFLMEQMALREQLEEHRASQALDSLSPLLDDIDNRLTAARQRLRAALGKEGGGDLEAACRHYHELQFLHRLHEEALDLEERLSGA
ncbi:MAG: Fe-S protein assembly co-chaperone HscB [Gammaproteobacteria bacterium]